MSSREIKFRIRLKSRKNQELLTICVPLFDERNGLMQFSVDLIEFEVLGIDEYTGLRDRNGKEIYEGDILHWKCSKSGSDDVRNHVVTLGWRNHGYEITIHANGEKWATGRSYWNDSEREVIGNIYENPSLLTGGDSA